MNSIPFWNRLSTRLGLLILLIVLVLALATAILVARGFGALQQDAAVALNQLGLENNLPNIISRTVVNLLAVFLLTLVGATVFSRSFLTEPITSLVDATQEIARGNLGVTLPVTSNSELGMLATAFNQMSTNLDARTKELLAANEALKRNEAQLEQRVEERTRELMALLELSNNIALTTEDIPLIESIFDELEEITGANALVLFELIGAKFQTVVSRHELSFFISAKLMDAVEQKAMIHVLKDDVQQMFLPIFVHNKTVGVLALELDVNRQLSEEKVRLISVFANQAGVAIENMRLYTDVQEKAAFDERQHLARELHDSVSQALYSIVLGSHAAKKQLERDPKQAEQALDYVQNLAEAGLAEMRALIFELRPEVLEMEGLSAALAKQVEALEVRHKLKAEFEADTEPELSFATKQALFRIVQEALHNIVKHAKADHVWVSLESHPENVSLCIRDNGIGFDTGREYTGHLGLKTMRERANSLGGEFKVTSALGEGTRLQVVVPRSQS
ncbi:MAG: HAMP domain-containing protein [Trueperaceae bacterium]|nr:HAMP domain-containing protein [Trueperaceae bacterium]